MLRLVALLALALVASPPEAPPTALAPTGASQATDTDLQAPPASPALGLRVSVTSVPCPTRLPAPVAPDDEPSKLASGTTPPARPRWRPIPRLRSDAPGDD